MILPIVFLIPISFNQVFAPGEFPPLLNAIKFYDTNANGVFDVGTDQLIRNWKISVNGQVHYTSYFNIFAPGVQVTVNEFDPVEQNWLATTPKSFTNTMVNGEITNVQFGNLCIGTGGGKPLGFWSNQNGFTVLNDGNEIDSELLLLQNLNLKDGMGDDFNPSTYDEFRTWLLGANGSNMSYMLSAQLAIMALNVESGAVSSTTMLYVPGFNQSGFVSIGNLIDLANNSLHSGESKDTLESIKNVLVQGNNGQNYVQSTPCEFSFKKSK